MNKQACLRPSSIVTHGNRHVASEVDGQVMMLSVERSSYYGLDGIGSRIWKLAEQPTSVSTICESLQREYAVDPAVCERDVLDLLEELFEEGLIRAVDEGAG